MPYADVSQDHGRPGKRQVLPGTLVLLLAFGLRLVQLGAGSIWYDESVSIYLAGLDLPAMVAHTAGDIHPPSTTACCTSGRWQPAKRSSALPSSLCSSASSLSHSPSG